jgi:hypothetical protein
MQLTNAEEELSKGRIALWLSPEQLTFLANEWRKIPTNAPENVQENWHAIAFRSMTAMHKANIDYTPIFPATNEIYQLPNDS